MLHWIRLQHVTTPLLTVYIVFLMNYNMLSNIVKSLKSLNCPTTILSTIEQCIEHKSICRLELLQWLCQIYDNKLYVYMQTKYNTISNNDEWYYIIQYCHVLYIINNINDNKQLSYIYGGCKIVNDSYVMINKLLELIQQKQNYNSTTVNNTIQFINTIAIDSNEIFNNTKVSIFPSHIQLNTKQYKNNNIDISDIENKLSELKQNINVLQQTDKPIDNDDTTQNVDILCNELQQLNNKLNQFNTIYDEQLNTHIENQLNLPQPTATEKSIDSIIPNIQLYRDNIHNTIDTTKHILNNITSIKQDIIVDQIKLLQNNKHYNELCEQLKQQDSVIHKQLVNV